MEYVKSKLGELFEEYERLKRREEETRDQNLRLTAHIGKLEGEVEMLSLIGSSAHQATFDDALRHIRDKHAKEIGSWKNVVKELEGELRSFHVSPYCITRM